MPGKDYEHSKVDLQRITNGVSVLNFLARLMLNLKDAPLSQRVELATQLYQIVASAEVLGMLDEDELKLIDEHLGRRDFPNIGEHHIMTILSYALVLNEQYGGQQRDNIKDMIVGVSRPEASARAIKAKEGFVDRLGLREFYNDIGQHYLHDARDYYNIPQPPREAQTPT